MLDQYADNADDFSAGDLNSGPNFALMVNLSLTPSHCAGIYTALGVATGSGLFAMAGLFGVILLLKDLPYVDVLLPFLGGGYLLCLGMTMVWQSLPKVSQAAADLRPTILQRWQADRTGLFTLVVKFSPLLWAKFFLKRHLSLARRQKAKLPQERESSRGKSLQSGGAVPPLFPNKFSSSVSLGPQINDQQCLLLNQDLQALGGGRGGAHRFSLVV
ncbi:MAG: hypothetical protein CSA34_05770 [Desulfobulbus propionicus]|nr:MAG: hypothetical protein CSA34_05770 [Desulfobulbus propionicus]